jgi:sulfur-oxidizing protein SoxY
VRVTAALTEIAPHARLSVSHPNHTGMVLDQLTLLYVPLRIITDLEVRQGDERVFAMKGSITLSQNPVIDFDYRVNGAETMQVLVTDSDGASWQKSFPIGQGS